MFKDRTLTSPIILRDLPADPGWLPQIDDEATLVVRENNIQIQVTIKAVENGNYTGEIFAYHPKITKRTPSERLVQIQELEQFVTNKSLENGSEISFTEIKVHALAR